MPLNQWTNGVQICDCLVSFDFLCLFMLQCAEMFQHFSTKASEITCRDAGAHPKGSIGRPEMPSSDRRPGKRMSGKRRENQFEIGLK